MRNLNIAIRSLFKKGRHNVMKIISLSVGLSVALVMIAKIYFEQSLRYLLSGCGPDLPDL